MIFAVSKTIKKYYLEYIRSFCKSSIYVHSKRKRDKDFLGFERRKGIHGNFSCSTEMELPL